MPLPLPPYALSAPAFPFPHLAGLAGRAQIGGAREVALACFVAARLAVDCTEQSSDSDGVARSARAVGAKAWLGTLALPVLVRGPLLRCVETSSDGLPGAVGRAVAELAVAGVAFLDAGSLTELESLAVLLRA